MEVLTAESLAAIVAGVEPGAVVVGASGLPGGLSSWMTVVEVERADGSQHRLVVRRGRRPDAERPTLPFGHEFALLEHLHARGVPVARPRAFDDSGQIIPQAYIVLDFVHGTTPFRADDPRATAVQMAEVLAAIHDLDAADPVLSRLPSQVDRMQDWVIEDLTRRELDLTLREDLIRSHLDDHWPPPAAEVCLLHADLFPGNVIWEDGSIAAVIDWEAAALGDPMADLATTRLDLRWAYGAGAARTFTERYLELTDRSTATLPIWELVSSLRPAGAVSLWATDMAAHGRPDITAASMRAEHRAHVDSALRRLTAPVEERS